MLAHGRARSDVALNPRVNRMTERLVPDLRPLVAPIPGPDPAGRPLSGSVRRRLEDARRVVDPDAFAASDPLRPAARKDPDWDEIVSLCTAVLTTTSKDLNVAARLTEALSELHGFAGLAAGLRLLRALVQDAWDRVYPPLTDEPDARALPFVWLAEPGRGARFPAKVRLVPLFRTDSAGLSWHVWRDSQDGRGKAAFDLDGFLRDIPRREGATRVEDLTRCRDELAALDRALADRMGDFAPGLSHLAAAVEDCLGLALHLAQQMRTGDPSAPQKPARPVVPPRANLPFAAPADRDEILQQLNDAAAALQELEPHSPVPHVLFWAIGLARLPAVDAVRELFPHLGALNGWAPEPALSCTSVTPPHEDP
jgi:type VI secretion system protein ImpA